MPTAAAALHELHAVESAMDRDVWAAPPPGGDAMARMSEQIFRQAVTHSKIANTKGGMVLEGLGGANGASSIRPP